MQEVRRTSTQANIKVGMAFAGAAGIGGLLLLTQFMTLGLLMLTTAGGALGGYVVRIRQEKAKANVLTSTSPNSRLINASPQPLNSTTPHCLGSVSACLSCAIHAILPSRAPPISSSLTSTLTLTRSLIAGFMPNACRESRASSTVCTAHVSKRMLHREQRRTRVRSLSPTPPDHGLT